MRGVTVSMALEYLAPARATDLIGVGRVLRRGTIPGQLRGEIVDPTAKLVAKAIATYKVG